MKSKVQHLKDCYNSGETVYLEEHEPNIVAGVLKQFLRELPEPALTNALVPKFEEASSKPISLFLTACLRDVEISCLACPTWSYSGFSQALKST